MKKELDFDKIYDKINDVLAKKQQLPLNSQEKAFLHWKFIELIKDYQMRLEANTPFSEYALGKQLKYALSETVVSLLNHTRR
jgi:hypothetical protein